MDFALSLRWKITTLVVSVAALLSALNLWLIPSRAAEAEAQEVRERADILATMLARPLSVAIDLEQPPETLRESLSTATDDPLVKWAAAYDKSGKLLAKVGELSAPQQLPNPSNVEGISGRAKIGSAETKPLGTAVVLLDDRRIDERRDASRQTMLLQSAVILGLGLFLALLLSGRMTRAMTAIAASARQITRGDVSQLPEMPLGRDELGMMARDFKVMSAQLQELQQSVVRVAEGDLTVSISGEGELFKAFRTMVTNLRDLASGIGGSSDSMSEAAASMFSLVRGHESTVTQQNAALEEIRRTIEALATNAQHVSSDAGTVRKMADESLTSTQRIAEQTRLVSAHSERIGEILSLIQDIADKSDLLALNAALEGTKAGEVGKGFSIVAAEMRRLSEHVMDSVRDIRKLVSDMREASHASVLATEQGIKLAKDTAASAAKISDAVSQQREGTTQVKTAVVEISDVVNNSLNNSFNTTRSAESMLQRSHELKTAASVFRVNKDNPQQAADGE